ncbi:MAG: TVP38/TMEM64 family protein [Anaerolineales bacterium]|nr:TVP38/TMEM64 family protein [Anaerolineales bacterium]
MLAALWLPLSRMGANPAAIRAWLEQLGPLAPLAFFLLNIIQIVVAPIPGYPVQVLGGILFGFIPGTIYTVGGDGGGRNPGRRAGTLAGPALAGAAVGRRHADPLERHRPYQLFLGVVAHSVDPLWRFALFFAGLTKIRLRVFALAILASRGPFTALLVWTGSSVADLPLGWLAVLTALVGVVVIAGFSQRARIEAWRARLWLARRRARTCEAKRREARRREKRPFFASSPHPR